MADWSHLKEEIAPNPAASAADIAAAQERCGGRLPDDYLDFLAHHNGGERVSRLLPAREVAPVEAAEPGLDPLEGLVEFGGTGGGEAFCFDDDGNVLVVPFIGDREDAMIVGDFTRFTHRLAAGELFD